LRGHTHAPGWQRWPADPVDQQGVAACCEVLAPAALDRYEPALAQRRQQPPAVDRAQQDAVQRLE